MKRPCLIKPQIDHPMPKAFKRRLETIATSIPRLYTNISASSSVHDNFQHFYERLDAEKRANDQFDQTIELFNNTLCELDHFESNA